MTCQKHILITLQVINKIMNDMDCILNFAFYLYIHSLFFKVTSLHKWRSVSVIWSIKRLNESLTQHSHLKTQLFISEVVYKSMRIIADVFPLFLTTGLYIYMYKKKVDKKTTVIVLIK